jgi:hypothetical protein
LDAIVIVYLSLYISNSSSKYDNNKIGACYYINDGPLLMLVDQSLAVVVAAAVDAIDLLLLSTNLTVVAIDRSISCCCC